MFEKNMNTNNNQNKAGSTTSTEVSTDDDLLTNILHNISVQQIKTHVKHTLGHYIGSDVQANVIRTNANISQELSLSLPNLTENGHCHNVVNNRQVCGSLTEVVCKRESQETMSNGDVTVDHEIKNARQFRRTTIAVEVDPEERNLSSVLQNMDLVYIPHAKQLRSPDSNQTGITYEQKPDVSVAMETGAECNSLDDNNKDSNVAPTSYNASSTCSAECSSTTDDVMTSKADVTLEDTVSFSSLSSATTDLSVTLTDNSGGVTSEAAATRDEFTEVSLASRNTYEKARRGSVEGLSPSEDGVGVISGAKPKKKGGLGQFFSSPRQPVVLYSDEATSSDRNFFARKGAPSATGSSLTCEHSQVPGSAPGWKLFGRVPPKHAEQQTPGDARLSEATRRSDVEVSSTTALILHNRPSGLPSKNPDEELKHQREYEALIEAAKKRELREAKEKKKQMKRQLKHEDCVSDHLRVWNKEILPHWESMHSSRKAHEIWWHGLPPSVRGAVWQLAIGNDLNITAELYDICVKRATERLRLLDEFGGDTDSVSSFKGEPASSKEASVELIKLDVSRTFPQLCIFQKGGPYCDLLQCLLGAYATYRPDIGYVQGMSYIAAILLLNMNVSDAFACFANLLNRPCQIKAYFHTFEVFFEENLPRLFDYFKKLKLTPDLFIIDWMFSLYAKSLPIDIASRVWDVFMRDGILRLYEAELHEMDFIVLAQYLTRLPEHMDCEALFHAIGSISMTTDNQKFVQVLATAREQSEST